MGIRAELHLKNFGLDYDQPVKFVTSQWGHGTFYTLWRVFWAIFHSVWVVASLWVTSDVTTTSSDAAKWFIYLSNWTYLTLTLETCTEAVVLIWTMTKRKDIISGTANDMPWYFKMQWLLYTIVTSGSFHISAFYWLIIFKDQTLTPVRVAIHGINSIYVFLNILITATPLRLYHFIYPVAYGTVYTLFTVVYFCADGTNLAGEPYIYRVLKWDHLKSTLPIVCISTFVVLPFEHCFVFLLYKLRTFCHKKQRTKEGKEKHVEANCNAQSQVLEKDTEDV
ncbi:protein rolling stone-like [Gigantopelta aegis]|uniref:protein rolling stone-like n=1 Tax=Gigantopelta aegis TaxID=1735272 RepID=UPI001B88E3DE|nr:protein rolling stone-like [Gigantopelta aegis]